MSEIFRRAKSAALSRELRRTLGKRFTGNAAEQTATVLDSGQLKIGGQRYPATGISASAGQTVTVRNVGRPGNATYAPATGSLTVSSGGRSGSSGGTTPAATAFLDLLDTPASYTSSAGYFVQVDSTPAGLAFSQLDDADLASTTAVLSARTITSGAGLTGGGDLSANRTLAVGAGTLITVAADAVGITPGTTYQFIGTGSGTAAGWRNVSELAGAGLTAATGVLAVGAGNGISVAADSVALTTPGTLTVSTSNSASGNHLHAVASSSNPGAVASLLATDASGFLSLVKLQTDTIADKSGGNLTIAPAGDLVLTPGGADTLVTWGSEKSLTSSDYVSQTTGWGISYGTSGGHADFRSMYADELHVQAFTADVYQAMVGAIIITKSRGRLSRNFTIPATGLTGTIYLEDLEELADTAVFASGDNIRLRVVDTSGGGLIVADVWGTVGASTDLSGGEQSYVFTTTDDGGEGDNVIFAGSIALDYGQTGGVTGVWEATVLDQAGAPYSQVKTWATDPFSPGNFTTHLRLGNLDGIAGIGVEYGLWAGQNTTDKYILLSDNSFETHGLKHSLYYSGTETIRLDPSAPSIALGATLPTAFGDDGIWMGRHSDGTYRLSMEEAAGDHYLRWTHDGSRYYLDISGDLYLHDSPGAGGDDLGATLTIDSYGQIAMGSNGSISMGASSSFSADADSTFLVGSPGSGDYMSFAAGVLTIKGMIVVTDGEDLDALVYTPENVSISLGFTLNIDTPDYLTMDNALPYSTWGNIVGTLTTAEGNSFYVKRPESLEDNGLISDPGSRFVTIWVFKTHPALGTGPGGSVEGGLSNPKAHLSATLDTITCYFEERADYQARTSAERKARVIIAHAVLSSDYTSLESLEPVGKATSTIITPEFINTPNIAAISADLGSITAGKITVTNGSNTLWLNDGTNDIVLAAGTTSGGIAAAAFRVYEDGRFHAGGAVDNYVEWNGTTLAVKGTINADAGYLGALDIDGNLTMSGGKIQWNSNTSYIDDSKIYITESGTKSITRIGDTTQAGLIDMDLFESASSVWGYGIHISDGGNQLSGASSLYMGYVDETLGANSVDAVYRALVGVNADPPTILNTGTVSDGYYGLLVGGSFSGAPVNGSGIAIHHYGPGVAGYFDRKAAGYDGGPTIFAAHGRASHAVYWADIGAATQTAYYVDDNGRTDHVALNAGSGGVEYVRYQRFINLATATAGAADAGVPAASGTQEFIVYARQGALYMKNSVYEWPISTGTPSAL